MIRLLLADDEELIRTAVAALLSLAPDLEVVTTSGTGTTSRPSVLSATSTSCHAG